MLLCAQDDYWFKKGMNEKNPEKQVEYFTKSIETEKAAAETYLHRGNAYKDLAIDRVYSHHSMLIVFSGNETNNARLMYDKAINDYGKAINLDPGCSDAYINLSEVHWQIGQSEKALADLTNLINIDSLNAKAYQKRSFIYENNYQDHSKAISGFTRAVEIDPDFTDAYYSRAVIYYRVKQYNDALADLNKIIDIDSSYIWAYSKRGDVFRALGQFDRAVADYDKTIKLDSKNYIAYNSRGCLYLVQNNYEKALHDFNKSLSINSKNFQPYCNIGYIFIQQNNTDKAIQYLQKSLNLAENFPDANIDMAIACYMTGKSQEAKTYLYKARAADPKIFDGFDGISKIESGGHNWNDHDLETLRKMIEELR